MKNLFLFFSSLLLLNSCGKNAFLGKGGSTESSIFPIATGVLSITTDGPYEFEDLIPNDSNIKTFTVTNNGDVSLDGVTFSSNSSLFEVVSNSCAVELKPGQSCEYTVSFNPDSDGNYTGEVTLSAVAGNEQVQKTIQLTGSGNLFDQPVGNEFSLDFLKSDEINFSQVGIGSLKSKLLFLSLSNPNLEFVKIRARENTMVTVELQSSSTFCQSSNSLSCPLKITVSPTSEGDFSEYVYIEVKNSSNEVITLPIKIVFTGIQSSGCTETYEELSAVTNPLNYDNYVTHLTLPYLTSSGQTAVTLETLYNNDFNQVLTQNGQNVYYIKNAMAFFSFEVAPKNGEDLTNTRLLLDMYKMNDATGEQNKTEIICLLDVLKCSGKRFYTGQYQYLVNSNFSVLNEDFISEIESYDQVLGNVNYLFHGKLNFNFSASLDEDLTDIENLISQNETLSFTVADDTKLVRNPFLILEYQKTMSCQ